MGQLEKDNYASWSLKMKQLLLFNEVWDLVSGIRVRPDPTPAAIVVADGAHANQAAITAATKEIRDYEKSYVKAACIIAAAISDKEILAVGDVLSNPVETWAALSRKYARKSRLEAESAHMALL